MAHLTLVAYILPMTDTRDLNDSSTGAPGNDRRAVERARMRDAQEIAAAWWRRRALGERVAEAEIIAAHSNLMPELAEQLRYLRLMQPQQRQQAPTSSIWYDAEPSPQNGSPHRTSEELDPTPETLHTGQLIADRYSIIDRLGEGGLGEVYLAYDQSLRTKIAVKILRVAHLASCREQLVQEVRLAQRVSHIHVCRVHDLVLDANPPMLTMEYIDGEDLDKTLLRIGRFAPERALQISVELCRGLAAAHQQGLIHRDLKPKNVMLDSAGLVRITDFGLARRTLRNDLHEIAGTHFYMSPEQRRGEGTNEASDIYSLGVVLFEIFTGVHPGASNRFRINDPANGEPDLITHVTPPSAFVPDIDAKIEATILRCLRDAPNQRPATVREVLSELTGKPVMRRDERKSHGRSAATRVRWLAIMATVGLIMTWLTSAHYQPLRFVNFTLESAEAYRDRATSIVSALGHTPQRRRDKRAGQFRYTSRFRNEPGDADRRISYWYRQSATPMYAESIEIARDQETTGIHPNDPQWNRTDMVGVELAPDGSLREYRSTSPGSTGASEPPTSDSEFGYASNSDGDATSSNQSSRPTLEGDLELLFEAAGLDVADYRCDAKLISINKESLFGPLGEGRQYRHVSDSNAVPVFVKTDAGRVLRFWPIVGKITTAKGSRIGDAINDGLFMFVLVAAVAGCWLARRNAHQMRADFLGARVSAVIVFVSMIGSMIFSAQHQVELVLEVRTLQIGLCNAMFWAAVQWVLYLALEPFVRRDYPRLLDSWNRAVRGDWRDSLVVTHVFLAAMLATVSIPLIAGGQAFFRATFGLPIRFGIPPGDVAALSSPISMLLIACNGVADSMYFGLSLLLLPMVLKKVFGNLRMAAVSAWLVNSVFYGFYFGGGIEPLTDRGLFFAYMSLWAALHLFVVLRLGLLPGIVLVFVSNLLYDTPFSLDHWFGESALWSCALLLLVIWAYAGWYLLQVTSPSSNREQVA